MLTMRSALERAERLFGENTAIIDAEARFTWAEHLDRVKRLAGVLQENGIGKGDRFGIICRNTWRHCELIHAGYWNGSVPVPVNYRLAPPEIRYILEDAQTSQLFIEGAFLDLLKKGDDRARAVRLKLAGVLDGGADEYTLPSREEVEAKRNDARAAAAAKAPPPPPPAPRGRSTRAKRDPRDGRGRYG